MADEPPRRLIEIGTLPTGYGDTFIDGVDPVSVMIADAIRRDDLAKAEVERQRQAAIADAERAKATRRARALRRLTKAFKAFARL